MKQISYILCSLLLLLNFACNAMNNQNNVPTHYEILGVAQDATTEEITKEYRKLALRNHPDRNPGNKEAEERFKHISTAYDILKDNEQRRRYDNELRNPGTPFGGDDFFNMFMFTQCNVCNIRTPIFEVHAYNFPGCGHHVNVCNNCPLNSVINNTTIQCPYCDNILMCQQRRFGGFNFRQAFACNAVGCNNRTIHQHVGPCCNRENISICNQCAHNNVKLPCSHCHKNLQANTDHFGNVTIERDVRYPHVWKGIIALGSGAIFTLCKTAWIKYNLRKQLDVITHHAQKLIDERYTDGLSIYEISSLLQEQFDIPKLLHQLKAYISDTTELQNILEQFDTIISAKRFNMQLMEPVFEKLIKLVNDYKNYIGSPIKYTAGATITALLTGAILSNSCYFNKQSHQSWF